MAATNFTPIQLYRTTTASAVPTAGNLADGELAINLTDERLYFKNAGGAVKLLASNAGSSGDVVAASNNAFTGANTFFNATGQTFGTATSTQDGIVLAGRAGGASSFRVTFQPTTLTASRTLTLPDATTTLVGTDATQTLTNKTLGTGTTLSATVTGSDNLLTRVMLQDAGWDWHDSGTTNALNFVNGSHQRWAPSTGAQTLSITNWPPSGNLGELLIEGVNLGAATITWPTVNWINPDGTTTTTASTYFSNAGRTLKTSGTDFIFLWTRDAGTTIYGKVV